jgi:ribosome-binding ATPase YchF (GTP1/OBG family)
MQDGIGKGGGKWYGRPGRRDGARGGGRDPTDLERGFIRAEVISYEDLVAAGSMDAAEATGEVRVEGKDYRVQEGDILHVRFAV